MNENQNKKTNPVSKIAIWVIGICVLLFVIIGISNSGNKSNTSSSPTPQVSTVKNVYDIPSLVGKNADQITEELKPYKTKSLDITDQQIKAGINEWEVSFSKDSQDLLVTYTVASKEVVDFFISSDDPSGATKDKKHLLEIGNLSESDPKYKVEFVKVLKDPSSYTGVKVTPR